MNAEQVKTIKTSAMESLDDLYVEIGKLLPQIKTEWHQTVDKEGKTYFNTEINGVDVDIHQYHVEFYINKGGLKEHKRIFRTLGQYNKPIQVSLYTLLSKRFEQDEDYVFYKRVLRFLNGKVNAQKARERIDGNTFTENIDANDT